MFNEFGHLWFVQSHGMYDIIQKGPVTQPRKHLFVFVKIYPVLNMKLWCTTENAHIHSVS